MKDKASRELRRPLASLIPNHINLVPENVASFSPKENSVTTTSGSKLSYDVLVVAAGIQTNWDNISGLSRALADPSSGVSSIYSYQTCDKVWGEIEGMRTGKALFTQPAGVVKCAGGNYLLLAAFSWKKFMTSRQLLKKLCGLHGIDSAKQGGVKGSRSSSGQGCQQCSGMRSIIDIFWLT